MRRLLLFDRCAGLENRVEWISLGDYPTPVEKMPGLERAEGLSDFYIKRDDLSSAHYGGNKVRKLEFLLARAIAGGHRSVVTFGAVGSNHVLATVIHGERMGIKTIAVTFPQPNAAYVRRNLLLDYTHGATFVNAPSQASTPAAFGRAMSIGYDAKTGKFPYVIPPGGSNPRGCLGHVEAALELKVQVDAGLLPEPDLIFVTLGSSGTAAGLILGVQLAGLSSSVVPVRVVEKPICNRYYLAFHVEMARRFITRRCPRVKLCPVSARSIPLVDDFAGDMYARFTPQCVDAVTKVKELDGIKLDGTYTGKTMVGALDFIHRHGLEKKRCLFWNTLNSADLYPGVRDLDYHLLPVELHEYFEKPMQEEEMGCEIVY